MSINPKPRRGFSLMEVVIALTILVLISGSVYSVLRGCISTAATMRESQARQQEIDGLLTLCHQVFHQLPAQTLLEARVREQNGRALPEIIFRNSPELFAWDNSYDLHTVSVLGLKPQIGGRFSLALLRCNPGRDIMADPVANSKPEDWVTLVPDVTRISWRFFERNSNNWLAVLPRGSKRPGAVEMKLELADMPSPIRMVFDVIPLAPPISSRPRIVKSEFSPTGS